MGNEWINFVRQFAKDNNITYSQAIKKAAPAYRKLKKGKSTIRGQGDFDDLPDETQSEQIVPYLDNKSLVSFAQSNKRTSQNEAIDRDLRRRTQKARSDYPHLKSVALKLNSHYTPVRDELQRRTQNRIFNVDFAEQYYDRVDEIIPILRRWATDPLLTNMQRRYARGISASLADRKDDIREELENNNQLANAPPPRSMYQRLFGS